MIRKAARLLALACMAVLVGCQSMNTTEGGVVGVQRKQYVLNVLSADEINQAYAQTYQETLAQARKAGALDNSSAQARRVQEISRRLIGQTPFFRADAAGWDWQISLIRSPELNASCGPGGKIIVYEGLVKQLQLTDAEIAAVLGHEMAHALREHSREQVSRAYTMELAMGGIGALLGANQDGMQAMGAAVNYGMLLPNSRQAETEADLIGIELAARAGYDPAAAISLWQKMERAGNGAPPQFMSTHPSSATRMQNLQQAIPRVLPLYQQAQGRR